MSLQPKSGSSENMGFYMAWAPNGSSVRYRYKASDNDTMVTISLYNKETYFHFRQWTEYEKRMDPFRYVFIKGHLV